MVKIYKPLDYASDEAVINPPVAYIQAARALDAAAQRAVELNDGETLVNVAALWVKIAENLTGDGEDEDEEKKGETHETSSIGFKVENGEELDAETGTDREHEDLQGRCHRTLG